MGSGSNGTLSTPSYPCNYPHNSTCTWTITAEMGKSRDPVRELNLQIIRSSQSDTVENFTGTQTTVRNYV